MRANPDYLIRQYRDLPTVVEDFVDIDSKTRWNVTEADASASVDLATGASAVGGKMLFTTGAVDNAEAYIASQEVFKFATDQTIVAECIFSYTEANTDDANLIFGFMDAVGANALIDDGGGPKAAYSGAVIYKIDGSNLWRVEASANGGAEQKGATSTLAPTAVKTALRIEAVPLTSSRMDVSFSIDPAGGNNFVGLVDTNLVPVRQTIDISTVTEMSLMFGVKAGGANSETPLLDFIGATQVRA